MATPSDLPPQAQGAEIELDMDALEAAILFARFESPLPDDETLANMVARAIQAYLRRAPYVTKAEHESAIEAARKRLSLMQGELASVTREQALADRENRNPGV